MVDFSSNDSFSPGFDSEPEPTMREMLYESIRLVGTLSAVAGMFLLGEKLLVFCQQLFFQGPAFPWPMLVVMLLMAGGTYFAIHRMAHDFVYKTAWVNIWELLKKYTLPPLISRLLLTIAALILCALPAIVARVLVGPRLPAFWFALIMLIVAAKLTQLLRPSRTRFDRS